MNQQIVGQKTGPDTGAGSGSTSAPAAGAGKPATSEGKGASAHQAVLGPFTIRDLAVFAATLILFIASLLPIFGGRYNLWNLNNLFFLGLGIVLPLVVSALFAARRLAPGTKIRIGSLSIDQFASVVASFAVAFFFLSIAVAYVPSLLVGLIGALVLFAATVLGRFLPYVSPDFPGPCGSPGACSGAGSRCSCAQAARSQKAQGRVRCCQTCCRRGPVQRCRCRIFRRSAQCCTPHARHGSSSHHRCCCCGCAGRGARTRFHGPRSLRCRLSR
jgi:hypothetical protein